MPPIDDFYTLYHILRFYSTYKLYIRQLNNYAFSSDLFFAVCVVYIACSS